MPRTLPTFPALHAVFCAAALMGALPAAQAGPLRVTVLDCGFLADCSGELTRITSFDTDTVLSVAAPAPLGRNELDVSVSQVLAGGFDGVQLVSFNVNGNIGSSFEFSGLTGEDGTAFAPLVLVGPWQQAGLRLQWDVGSFGGLGRVNCLNANCTMTTTIQSFVRVDIAEAPVHSVPAPTSALLALGALGAAAAAGRRTRR
jgi:hypothetical protein